MYGPQSSGSSPLLSANGTQLLTEKKRIMEKWAEHFDQVLNRPASINDEAVACVPEMKINQDLDNYHTEEEVRKAIKQLSCGKAPGSDAIPSEGYKAGGPVMLQNLTKLFQCMWREGKVLQQLKHISIVHIFRRKGNHQSCDNNGACASCP